MKKNEIYSLYIESVSSEGVGIGKIDGMAVFVPNTAPGDNIQCKIVKVKSRYAFGIIEQIIKSSEHRQEIDCEVFTKCGGCVYRHITYDFEQILKDNMVRQTIARIGGYKDLEFDNICADSGCGRYRNKTQIPLSEDKNGNLIMGFYAKHSHRIVETSDCKLQPEVFNTVMQVFKKWHKIAKNTVYNELTNKGLLRHLYMRLAVSSSELMLCVVSTSKKINKIDLLLDMVKERVPELKTVVINVNKEKTNVILGESCINIYGDGYITDTLCGLFFRISPLSFYQVNSPQAQRLYNQAKDFADLKPDDVLIDLYCGTGTIGLCLTDESNKLIGVEINEQAIEDAKSNAKLNNRNNTEFICADAKEAAKQLSQRGINPHVVVVDPPRKGIDKDLIATVCAMNAKRIVYISCDPATLARDLLIFKENGYIAQKARAFDLFPRTAHVETCVLLSRKDPRNCSPSK